MNISQEDLNAWARDCSRLNTQLHNVQSLLRRGNPHEALVAAETARAAVWALKRRMEAMGAESRPLVELSPIGDTPLQLLDTPANRRYARALRAAWDALKEVELERSIEDGASEVLEDWLAEVELEIHGPAGAGEGVR